MPSPRVPWFRRMPRVLPACAAALAIPAFVLTHESFTPIEQRVQLQGGQATWLFELAAPEPLFLEFEFTVRAAGEKKAGLVLDVNDTEVARIEARQLYVLQRAMPSVPLDTVRQGTNRLHVKADGPAAATFEMSLRLHNYYGINPQFPRAFVVSDEAVSHYFRAFSIGRLAQRFGAFSGLSLLVVWAISRVSRRLAGVSAYVLMLSPSVLLWVTLLYGLATPLHVWLSLEALVVVGLVPCLLTAFALWMLAHRAVVIRVAAATMVSLAFMEITLRFFNYVSPSFVFYTDSYSRYRGQPGAPHFDSRLNAHGFNDVDYEPGKPAGVYRVAAIGDSVAFGVVPYRANYLTLLEAELAAERRLEVVNLGVPGTLPKDYLAILVEEGLAFTPDLVMVGFFIGNDFESAAKKLYEHSYLATLLNFLWTMSSAGMPAVAPVDRAVSRYEDDQPSMALDRFLEIAIGRAQIYAKDEGALRTPLARAVGYLREMRDISQRAGANILVVLIPDEVQVDQELQGQVVRAYGSGSEQFDFRLPNRLLAGELSKQGIPFLDLLPVFELEGRHTRLYKPRDTHWNLAGNRLAATTIADFLRERVLSVGR